MEIKKIIITQGLPASGKSTWAKAWVKEDFEHRVRFNRDDIRNMLGTYWVPSREPLINDIYKGFLENAMLQGYDIVIDNMNLNPEAVKEIEYEVEDFNEWIEGSGLNIQYEIEYKSFLEVPLQTCIDRDSKRENPIGEMTIRRIFNKYKHLYSAWKYLN